MTLHAWHEEPIAKSHDRKKFDCGNADLNEFLQKHARQNHESGGAKTFCAIEGADPKRVLGFYSLAPAAIGHARLPRSVTKGLPQHEIGGFKLARIATRIELQGRGLGGQLLLAAGKRCLRVAAEVGGLMLIIEAKNGRAAGWYESYGAIRLEDSPLTLVLPLKTIQVALQGAGKL